MTLTTLCWVFEDGFDNVTSKYIYIYIYSGFQIAAESRSLKQCLNVSEVYSYIVYAFIQVSWTIKFNSEELEIEFFLCDHLFARSGHKADAVEAGCIDLLLDKWFLEIAPEVVPGSQWPLALNLLQGLTLQRLQPSLAPWQVSIVDFWWASYLARAQPFWIKTGLRSRSSLVCCMPLSECALEVLWCDKWVGWTQRQTATNYEWTHWDVLRFLDKPRRGVLQHSPVGLWAREPLARDAEPDGGHQRFALMPPWVW